MQAFGIVLGLLPGFAWMGFYLQEEIHPEPKKLIALTYVNGAAFAFIALVFQIFLKKFFDGYGIGSSSPAWLLSFAGIEELMKFWAAYAAVHRSPEFDEPVDAMIYAVVAALGFATVENVAVLSGGPQYSFFLANIFPLITFRFVGATLLHTLTSGIFGYYWARDIRAFRSPAFLGIGFLIASLIHAIFNFLVVNYGPKGIVIIFLIIVGFFVLADFEKLRERML